MTSRQCDFAWWLSANKLYTTVDHVFVFLTDETRPELERRLSVIGAELMLDVIKDLDKYRLGSKLQNEDNVTYGNFFSKFLVSVHSAKFIQLSYRSKNLILVFFKNWEVWKLENLKKS